MIRLKQHGQYDLSKTKNETKILTIYDDQKASRPKTYAWIDAGGIGELLISPNIRINI